MRTIGIDKNSCNDKWLAALVDAMDEVESLRADDFCRTASIPSGLIAQLYGQAPKSNVRRQWAPSARELA